MNNLTVPGKRLAEMTRVTAEAAKNTRTVVKFKK